ncbi:MAG: hypothetical protein V2I33_20740 [Kangiellaceae bacterium]|nr:hypothetical protein [Kangiellaceae bacterium]
MTVRDTENIKKAEEKLGPFIYGARPDFLRKKTLKTKTYHIADGKLFRGQTDVKNGLKCGRGV